MSAEKGRVALSPEPDRLATDAEAPGGRPVPVEPEKGSTSGNHVRIAHIVAAGVNP